MLVSIKQNIYNKSINKHILLIIVNSVLKMYATDSDTIR